jgi:hypothetical protein
MRVPRIPGKRCGTRLVALMCASSPDPYAHRLAGTAHPRPSSRLASRTAGLALASATKSEPGPCSPPRGDTWRAAVAHLPMRSARWAPSPHVSAHRRRQRRPERQGGLPSPRTPGSASNGRLHGRSRDARKGRPTVAECAGGETADYVRGKQACPHAGRARAVVVRGERLARSSETPVLVREQPFRLCGPTDFRSHP